MAEDKKSAGGQEHTRGEHADAEKIGGTAQRNPNWGKQYPSDPAAAGNKPGTRDERGGKPKTSQGRR